ncbi:reverse transcriptase [Senna tora]|uniref:Reverse transcriptase n=1 Tax=Senna tora TaxID=362788 RepID=A0A834WII7_9FABA|nr:reverse transcriptase [Senna tora]
MSKTHIEGNRADQILASFGFINHFKVDPMGFAGGGDFNDILSPNEKGGGANLSFSRIMKDLMALRKSFRPKARLDWVMHGDSNTKFFHALVVGRRRSNRITRLKDNCGNWIHNFDEVKDHIVLHFQNLFKVDHVSRLDDEISNLVPTTHLSCALPSNEEIFSTLNQFKPFKAPDPDGF